MKEVTISFTVTEEEAMALAQMCKRMGYSDFVSLSDMHMGDRELNAMMRAESQLRRALGDAGFAPR